MAKFTFTFTIPDEQMARVDAALHKYFGPVMEEVTPPGEGEKGEYKARERTKAELQAAVCEMVGQRIREIIAKVEARDAMEAAAQSVNSAVVDVTIG